MAQIFHRSTNTFSKVSIFGAILIVVGLITLASVIYQSPYVSQAGVVREQPVPFSHEHHVRGLGIDCRYCHTTVEKSAFAGMPSTQACMSCHSQIWTNAAILEPVREAYRTHQPIHWTRVNHLPDYVYFDHSIHVKKGVACTTCHGPVGQMPLLYQEHAMHMNWCLECHRHPEKYVGPQDKVFQADWHKPDDITELSQLIQYIEASSNQPRTEIKRPEEFGKNLAKLYHIHQKSKLEDCYTCHR